MKTIYKRVIAVALSILVVQLVFEAVHVDRAVVAHGGEYFLYLLPICAFAIVDTVKGISKNV